MWSLLAALRAGFFTALTGGDIRSEPNPLTPATAELAGAPVEPFRYTYSVHQLEAMGQRLRLWAIEQKVTDLSNAEYAPRLYSSEDVYIVEDQPISFSLGSAIARQEFSVLYRLRNSPDRVVKYQANCSGDLGIHPLLRDFWFQNFLRGTGIAAAVHYISPPAKYSIPVTVKTNFNGSTRLLSRCIVHPESTVRFMVMDFTGESLHDTVAGRYNRGPGKSRLPLKFAIESTMSVIAQLKKLHSMDIIHGDLHWGNVVRASPDSNSLILIDFGMAFFASSRAGKPKWVRRPFEAVHCLLSPYEIEGHRPSYRDDIYRAVLMGAMLVYGMEYFDWCKYLESEPIEMLHWKNQEDLFHFHGQLIHHAYDKDGILGSAANRIQDLLTNVVRKVQSLDQIDELPPYDSILEDLISIIALIP